MMKRTPVEADSMGQAKVVPTFVLPFYDRTFTIPLFPSTTIPVELLLGCIASVILGFLGFIWRFRANTISVWPGNLDQSAEKVNETIIHMYSTHNQLDQAIMSNPFLLSS